MHTPGCTRIRILSTAVDRLFINTVLILVSYKSNMVEVRIALVAAVVFAACSLLWPGENKTSLPPVTENLVAEYDYVVGRTKH